MLTDEAFMGCDVRADPQISCRDRMSRERYGMPDGHDGSDFGQRLMDRYRQHPDGLPALKVEQPEFNQPFRFDP